MPARIFIPIIGLLLVVGAVFGIWLGGERAAPIPDPPLPPNLDETEPAVVEMIQQSHASVMEDRSDPHRWLRLGMIYEANTNNAFARECYEQSVILDQSCARCWFHTAMARFATSDYDNALDAMREVTVLAEGFPPGHWRLGFWQLEQGDVLGAEASFTRATRLAPRDPAGSFGMAMVRMKQGRDEEAAQILENVLEWCPVNRFYGNQLLGTVYRRLGRLEEAQRVLLSSQGREVVWPDQWMNEISSFHRGAGWKIELPMQLLGRGRTDEAIQMLRQFLQTESDNPILLSNLAIAYRTNGDLDRSIELLKQAIDLREHYHQAHFNLGLAYLLVAEEADTAGDTQRAEAYTDYALHHASFALEVNPSYYSGHGLMGQVRERLGEFDQSLEEYRIAAKDFQTGVFWLGLRSALLTKLQRWPELADVLVHMLDRFPPQPQTMYDLALAQLKAGRGELAIQTVDRFGQLWPDDARVVQLHQAVQTARQAGPARPRSGVPQ